MVVSHWNSAIKNNYKTVGGLAIVELKELNAAFFSFLKTKAAKAVKTIILSTLNMHGLFLG